MVQALIALLVLVFAVLREENGLLFNFGLIGIGTTSDGHLRAAVLKSFWRNIFTCIDHTLVTGHVDEDQGVAVCGCSPLLKMNTAILR